MNPAVLVLVILVGVGLIQAAIWIPLTRSWRRRSDAFMADLHAETHASGEQIVVGPEKAVYRGATATYGQVRGNGLLTLTERRLVFRKLSGGVVDVPVDKIIGTRESKSFLTSRVGGATHLVVATSDPAEVGFFVDDLGTWERGIESVRRK